MGKKILDSKALYVVLAVIIAVALWFYVTSLDGNEDTKPISNIPITFVGVESLEAKDLMIVGENPTASVRVKAAPAVLNKLTRDSITLVVNVAKLEAAADYTLAYTAQLPSNVTSDQVEFVSGGTGNVSFTVSRYTRRPVSIRCIFEGTVADGYLPGTAEDFIVDPVQLMISGRAELVNQVSYALVRVTGKDLTASVAEEFPFELIGASGDVLKDLDVECDFETIYVSYPILATAEIPLVVKLVPGGGVTESQAGYTLSTDKIRVAGSKAAVDAIASSPYIITTIDLAEVEDGDRITCAIPLPEELTNLSGITQVIITVELSDRLVNRSMSTTNISCINRPEGWAAEIITQVVTVRLRGIEPYVSAVTEENLRVVADLSQLTPANGQYTVLATVYLSSASASGAVGVVGTDYRIAVRLIPELPTVEE